MPRPASSGVDAPVSPGWVLPSQAQDQGADGPAGWGPSRVFALGDLRVVAPDQVAVPAQDGVGGDDQLQLAQPEHWKVVQEGGQERPVRAGEVWLVDLVLQDAQLVAQGQDLDVLLSRTHGQEFDQGEQAGQGKVGQSRQHNQPV